MGVTIFTGAIARVITALRLSRVAARHGVVAWRSVSTCPGGATGSHSREGPGERNQGRC